MCRLPSSLPEIKPPVAFVSFYGAVKLSTGSAGGKAVWEKLRTEKPQEVAFAEKVYEGEQVVNSPILK